MEKYITCEQLLADVKGSSPFLKDNPNVIDPPTVYRWIYQALRGFGLNIMQKKGKTIEVDNFKAILPKDFGKLSLLVFCERDKCKVGKGCEDKLIGTYFYSDRIKNKYIIETAITEDGCKEKETCKEREEIIEKFFISDGNCYVTLTHKNPYYVKLGRDVLYDICTNDCINKNIKDSPYSVNIKGQIIYANFREGVLYCEYYAIPTDEEGLPIIPIIGRNKLEQYLEVMIKRKLLFELQLSGDKVNIQYLYADLRAEEENLLKAAHADVSPLSLVHFWKYIDQRRKDLSQFDIYLNIGNDYSYQKR